MKTLFPKLNRSKIGWLAAFATIPLIACGWLFDDTSAVKRSAEQAALTRYADEHSQTWAQARTIAEKNCAELFYVTCVREHAQTMAPAAYDGVLFKHRLLNLLGSLAAPPLYWLIGRYFLNSVELTMLAFASAGFFLQGSIKVVGRWISS